jgi:hypothetical protein
MPYTISTSDNSVQITVPDSQFDNTTLLTLAGPNAVGYGQYLDKNQLMLLENFASNIQPNSSKSLQGQLWFDKSNQVLNVYTDVGYIPINGITVGPGTPTVNSTTVTGNTWFDNIANQLYLFDGNNWNLIGPNYTKLQGVSGAVPVSIGDAGLIGTSHNVLEMRYGATLIAIISSDATFQPTPAIPGFPLINQGITFNNTLLNTTINSNLVGNVTGNVIGNLTGNVAGSLTGLQVNTTNVYNTGDMTSGTAEIGTAVINNFSSGNVQISGGTATGLTNLQTTSGATTNLPGQVQVGYVTTSSSTPSSFTNLNSTNFSATSARLNAVNASTVNAVSLGNVGTALTATNGAVTTLVAPNFSSSNVQISGGSLVGLTNLSGTNITASSVNTNNAQISGGAISGVSILQTSSLISGAATLNGATTITGQLTNTYTSSPATFRLLQADNFYSGTVNALNVYATQLGNTGSAITGTLTTSAQPNITQVGTINSGAWQGTVVQPQYGGTGVSNTHQLFVLGAARTLDQDVSSGAGPYFSGINFSGTATNLTAGKGQVLDTTAWNPTQATGAFKIIHYDTRLIFYFNTTPIASLDRYGNWEVLGDVTGFAGTI